MHLSQRIGRIEPSITLALDARAKALRAAGRDVVNMAVGEPDFAAPQVARRAAIELIESGDVKYTPAAGMPSLRDAIASHLERTRGGSWSRAEVTVCHSAKTALSSTLGCLVEDGDEVLVPLPAWASYFDQVRLTGANPVLVPSHRDAQGFHPDLEGLRAALTPKTRGLMINTPNNPSGSVWSREEVDGIAEFALEHGLWVLSDEIYGELIYDGGTLASPSSHPDARRCTLVVDGASKAFAMTGYRMGYVAGPEELTSAVATMQSQANGSPNKVGQVAWEAALRDVPGELEEVRARFVARRDHILAGLEALGLETPRPRGAFYAFPNVARFLDERGSVGFCEDLLESQLLTLVPGVAFGLDDHVRLSYATDMASIDAALERLGAFLETR